MVHFRGDINFCIIETVFYYIELRSAILLRKKNVVCVCSFWFKKFIFGAEFSTRKTMYVSNVN